MSLDDVVDEFLFGRSPTVAVRLLSIAGALFVGATLVHLPALVWQVPPMSMGTMRAALAVLVVVAAAGGAYVNGGVAVSVALAGGPALGFYLPVGLLDAAYPSETFLQALTMGVGFALAGGLVGYVLGRAGLYLHVAATGGRDDAEGRGG